MGAMHIVTDCEHVCAGARALAEAPGGAVAAALLEGPTSDLWQRVAACPPRVRWVPAHTEPPRMDIAPVDWCYNRVADADPRAAALDTRVPQPPREGVGAPRLLQHVFARVEEAHPPCGAGPPLIRLLDGRGLAAGRGGGATPPSTTLTPPWVAAAGERQTVALRLRLLLPGGARTAGSPEDVGLVVLGRGALGRHAARTAAVPAGEVAGIAGGFWRKVGAALRIIPSRWCGMRTCGRGASRRQSGRHRPTHSPSGVGPGGRPSAPWAPGWGSVAGAFTLLCALMARCGRCASVAGVPRPRR